MRQCRREISLILRVVILLVAFYAGQLKHAPCSLSQKAYFVMYSSPTDLEQFVDERLDGGGALRIEFTEHGGGFFFMNSFFYASEFGPEKIEKEEERRKLAGVPLSLRNVVFDHVMNFWRVENIIFELVVDIKQTMNLAFRASREDDFDCAVTTEHVANLTSYLNDHLSQWQRYLDTSVVFLTSSKRQKTDQVVYRASKMYEQVSMNVPGSKVIRL